jgi:hypothetical protein
VEIIETLAAGFVFFAVAAATMQVVFSYSLQVISEKNKLPDLASFLCWIPLLNLYPLIRCGGGSFGKFLLGSIGGGVLMAVAAGAAASSEAGPLGAAAAVCVFVLVALVYMASIVMSTAESRGLSKWLGLLTFVPLLNIFVYPYIAFHDGFRAPNKVGLLLGLLLAYGPLPAQIQAVDQVVAMARQYEGVLGAATDGSGFDAEAFQNAMGELGASMEMGDLAMLPETNAQPTAEMQLELDQAREMLDDMAGSAAQAPAQSDAAIPDGAMPAAAPDTLVGDRTGRGLAAPPARAASALTAPIGRDGDRGFATPEAPACPPGTEAKGSGPPDGLKRWCARIGADAGMKHGWLTAWHENQEMAMAGEYRDGVRVGVWTRWYPSGGKRVQAEFTDGLQHGSLIAWDEQGEKVYEGRFSAGLPVLR